MEQDVQSGACYSLPFVQYTIHVLATTLVGWLPGCAESLKNWCSFIYMYVVGSLRLSCMYMYSVCVDADEFHC